MPQSLISEFWRVLSLSLLGGVLGLLFSHPVLGLWLGLLAYLLQLLKRYQKFNYWLHQGLSEPGDFGGVLDELAFKIYRIRIRSRKRKKKLTELLRRWQDSAAALPDAAVVLDKDNIIVWFNSTASSMLNLKPADTGQHIGNLLREPRFIEYLHHAGFDEQLEITSPHHDNKNFNIRLAPYGSGQRLMLVTDVTHIQRLMNMRREFIANVSHELRTPLTVIMGYLESLNDGEDVDVDTLMDCLGRIEVPAKRMKSLVDDLLLLSRLDTSSVNESSVSSSINIHSLLNNLYTEAQQLSRGEHQIQLHVEPDCARIKGVEKEIYSAFNNLVTNALRYTPKGGEINISWMSDEKGGRFVVKDSGSGISVVDIPRLTERFYRVDVGRSRSSGGTGLGLAIVKQVLRRHEAELQIKSVLGQGSEFTCVFPPSRLEYRDLPKSA